MWGVTGILHIDELYTQDTWEDDLDCRVMHTLSFHQNVMAVLSVRTISFMKS